MSNAVVVMTSLSQLLTLLNEHKMFIFVRDASVYILTIRIEERLDTRRAQKIYGSAFSEVADKAENILTGVDLRQVNLQTHTMLAVDSHIS